MESQIQRLEISANVAGRDAEISVLRRIYSSAAKKSQPSIQLAEHSMNNNSALMIARPRCPAVYVSGLSGVGKTKLVQAAFESEYLGASSSYFVTGKFDLLRSHRPFAALVDALNALCAKVMERGGDDVEKLTVIREMILRKVSSLGLDALIGMVPNLEKLLERISNNSETKTTERSSHAATKQGFRKLKETIIDYATGDWF